MPRADQHPLERRATALAEALTRRVDTMAALMRPNGRQVFTQRLPEQQALEFFQRHRFDDLGQRVLSTWTPDQILDLDQRLMRANDGAA